MGEDWGTYGGKSQTVVEQAELLLGWIAGVVTQSQTAPVVILVFASSRFPKCKMCRAVAYLDLAVPVFGQDSNASIVQRWVLWMFVALILILLFLCHRFQLWRTYYHTVIKYTAVTRCGQPTTTVLVEEIAVIPTEKEVLQMTPPPVPEKVFPDVDIKDFVNKVRRLKMDSDYGFAEEFLNITDLTQSYNFPAENFHTEKNKNKNRYFNIPAYDHSRVVLKVGDSNLDQSDYINANYVHGYRKSHAYIATQGPLPNTVCDFWRMVWEQNSNVIVMITNFTEKGRSKCEQYWPTKGEEEYGNLTVRLMLTDNHAYYITRVFVLSDGKCDSTDSSSLRTVYHYHYTQWPDHGVPCHALPVLTFVLKSTAQRKPENSPVVVHCSAGVGRTGTYILIDSMIAQITDKRSVNIPGFLLDIRRQRHFLVQTEEQYKCIHEVLVEYLQGNGTTEVSEDHLSDYLPLLDQPYRSKFMSYSLHVTLLNKQFQFITEYTPKEFELSAALDSLNESKNKPGSLLPASSSRVLLPAKPDIAGSDYINATFLQGHTKAEEFIVTQHPAEDTVPDFWRMVWHVRSPVIVVLSYPREKTDVEFWPAKGADKNLDFEGFCITTKSESAPNYARRLTTIDVIVDFKEDLVTFSTRVIIVKDWPHRYKKLHRVFDPITTAHSFLTSSECGPVIVVDRFGGVEAGTFCALWTLRDQLLSERCADFYQVCKLYHSKRPGIFKSQEDYLFIHSALVALHKQMQARATQKNFGNLYHNFPSCDNI